TVLPTQLHEPASRAGTVLGGGKQTQGGVHELTGQGVEDHVHPPSAVGCAQTLLELQVSGGGQPVFRQTVLGQPSPLVWARGPKDPGPHVVGELHGGRADPARGGVHQDVLARADRGKVHQTVVGGLGGDGYGGRLFEGPLFGNVDELAPVGDGE